MATHAADEKAAADDVGKSSDAASDEAQVESLTKQQARRLLLKTDLVVMPLAVLTMTLAFLDKVCAKALACRNNNRF